MGLPRELIDEIMGHNDLQTLKDCSLTSRTFYSAARPFIHARMTLGIGSAMRGFELSQGTPFNFETYDEQADAFRARYLSATEKRGLLLYGYIREVTLDLSGLAHSEKVLQLQQLRALETVHTLTVESLALPQMSTSLWSLSAGSHIWMAWHLPSWMVRRWPTLGQGRDGRDRDNRYRLEVTWIYMKRLTTSSGAWWPF